MQDGGPKFPLVLDKPGLNAVCVHHGCVECRGQSRCQSLAETAMGALIRLGYNVSLPTNSPLAKTLRIDIIDHAMAFATEWLAEEERRLNETKIK